MYILEAGLSLPHRLPLRLAGLFSFSLSSFSSTLTNYNESTDGRWLARKACLPRGPGDIARTHAHTHTLIPSLPPSPILDGDGKQASGLHPPLMAFQLPARSRVRCSLLACLLACLHAGLASSILPLPDGRTAQPPECPTDRPTACLASMHFPTLTGSCCFQNSNFKVFAGRKVQSDCFNA